jgi:predicted GNAT family N-acyltransferase
MTSGSVEFHQIFKGAWLQPTNHAIVKDIQDIRLEVFVHEQNVPIELEMDGLDNDCYHVLASMKTVEASLTGASVRIPVATARLLPNGHIGRMAVIKGMRGQGIGSMIMKEIIQIARQQGFNEVILESQTHARQFYEKLGFVTQLRSNGETEFIVAGIPHVEMMMRIA